MDGVDTDGSPLMIDGRGGANYYEIGCTITMTNCTISENATSGYDILWASTSDRRGGGEYYENWCTAIMQNCNIIGNISRWATGGGLARHHGHPGRPDSACGRAGGCRRHRVG